MEIVAGSTVQTATAKDNAPAPFTKLVLKHHPKDRENPSWLVRVQVLIKWYKPSGGVEGTILFRPSWYYHACVDYTNFVGGQPYCQEVDTNG